MRKYSLNLKALKLDKKKVLIIVTSFKCVILFPSKKYLILKLFVHTRFVFPFIIQNALQSFAIVAQGDKIRIIQREKRRNFICLFL